MSWNKIQYKKGDIVGPNNCVYLEERSKQVQPSGQTKRKALFLCGRCNKNTFESTIQHVKDGSTKGCSDCAKDIRSEKMTKDITGQKFGHLTALYPVGKKGNRSHHYWHCKCDCGKECDVEISKLTNGHTKSCGHLSSAVEEYIGSIFTKHNIQYVCQYTFNDCINPKTGRKLRFDFYLPNYNCCLEYDGEQHFYPWRKQEKAELKLKECQERDIIKNQYCQQHNIKLVRIKYTEKDKIDFNFLMERIKDE